MCLIGVHAHTQKSPEMPTETKAPTKRQLQSSSIRLDTTTTMQVYKAADSREFRTNPIMGMIGTQKVIPQTLEVAKKMLTSPPTTTTTR